MEKNMEKTREHFNAIFEDNKKIIDLINLITLLHSKTTM